MKSVSAGMLTHLQGEALTLATLWRILRQDGQVFRFTDHDRDIVYGGETYLAAVGYQRSAITSGSDLAVDETELLGLLDSASISETEVRAGLWDGAAVRIFQVNWANLALGELKLRRGTLGEVLVSDDGSFRVELRGLAQPLQTDIGSVYQAECRADLGDRRCRVPIAPARWAASTAYALGAYVCADVTGSSYGHFYDEQGVIFECTTAGTSGGTQPAFDLTPPNTTADGSVVWTARTAWTRPATIETVSDSTNFLLVSDVIATYADAWFEGGVCIWDTGANAGVVREIIGWTQATRGLALLAPPPFTPAAGDVLRLQPGCNHTWDRCGVFNNRLNFRGEPLVPGANAIVGTPP